MLAVLLVLCGGGISVGEIKSLLSANLTFVLCVGEPEDTVPMYCGETSPESTCFNVKAPLSAKLFPFVFFGDSACSLKIVRLFLVFLRNLNTLLIFQYFMRMKRNVF